MSQEQRSLNGQGEAHSPATETRQTLAALTQELPAGLAELFQVDAEKLSSPAAQRLHSARPQVDSVGLGHGWSIGALRRWLGLLPRVLVVATLVWGLCFNFSEVRGSSMEPGILDHDRIIVDHFSYLLQEVQRGDIVILRYPLDPSVDYIKRVIGLPGDEVVLAGGKVWVNGEELHESYVGRDAIDPYTHARLTVAEGHYYVLGDNRLRSSDSREFGQVPHELLRGKVQACIWPLTRLRWIR